LFNIDCRLRYISCATVSNPAWRLARQAIWQACHMKNILLGMVLVLFAVDAYTGQQAGTDTQVAAAKTAIQELASALQSELRSAIQDGGPVSAIEVCKTKAMPITQRVSDEQGLSVNRVSLKNRNPANAPNEWETAVLEDFERQRAEGKDIGSLVWSDTVVVEGGQEFRFMKAIPTGDICLLCHGAQLAPDVSRVLAELYPADKATGFAMGDIRGAFVVTQMTPD